ncbi:tudor domain-containing protein 7-like isoform X2, partial [Argonauta hians]
MEQLKMSIRAVLQSAKNGVEASCFEDQYRSLTKENLYYKQYGFHSVEELMASLPDTVRIVYQRGVLVYRAVITDSTLHLQKLISRQKSAPTRNSKPLPNKRRPFSANENLPSHNTNNNNNNNNNNKYHHHHQHHHHHHYRYEDNRKKYPNVRVTVDSCGRGGGGVGGGGGGQQVHYRGGGGGDVKRCVEMGGGDLNANKHQDAKSGLYVSKSNRMFEKAMKAISSNEVPHGLVPPRFQKLKNSPPAPELVKGRQEHLLKSNKVPDGKKYFECLLDHVKRNSLPFASDLQYFENGFFCSFQIDNEVFKSSACFVNEEEAQYSAGKQACERLGLDPGLMADEQELKDRVQQIVLQNGLWLMKLTDTYEETFQVKAPDNLLDLVRSWTDLFRIEQACATQMEIVYPVKTPLVIFTGKEIVIENASLLPVGDTVAVYVVFIYSPCHFYVHLESTCMKDIDKELEEHCQKCGVDLKSLEVGGYCAAQYTDNDAWYRAQILSLHPDKHQVEIYYVDYGNVETVPIDRITKLPSLTSQYPAQAVLCSLYQLEPLQDEAGFEESKQIFSQFCENQLNARTVLIDDKNVCQVILHEVSPVSESDRSINDLLVSSELAHFSQVGPPDKPPPPNEPAPLLLPCERFWDVYVCFLSSLTDIIVRIVGENYSERLVELEAEIMKWFPEDAEDSIVEGDICAAKVDDSVHRVKVLHMDQRKTVECLFLDHGDSDRLALCRLRKLDPSLNYLPYQAIPCYLVGLEQHSCNFPAIERLMDMALGKTCVAEAVTKDNKIYAVLYDTSGDDDININKTIAEFAESEGCDLISSLAHDGSESLSSLSLSELSLKSTTTLENVMKPSGTRESLSSPTASSSSSSSTSISSSSNHPSPVGGGPDFNSFTPPTPSPHNTTTTNTNTTNTTTPTATAIATHHHHNNNNNAITATTTTTTTAAAATTTNKTSGSGPHGDTGFPVSVSSERPSATSPDSRLSAAPPTAHQGSGGWSRTEYLKLKAPGQFKMAPLPEVTFVYIEYITSPATFRIIPFDFLSKRDQFTASVTERMNTTPLVSLTEKDIQLNHLYTTCVDGCWYRVVPLNVNCGSYLVRYADYGGFNFHDPEDLLPLPAEFWNLPYQSVTCKLHNLVPYKGEIWSEAAKYKFHQLVANKCFACIVKEAKKKQASGDVVPVVLIDTSGEEDVCIDEVMVALRYAKYEVV